MKKRIKKVLAVIGIILLLFIILVGYLVYKDLKQEDVLKKEVINLSNKDLLEDNFNIDIKTTGDYAYVENAIKKYYKELSDNVKKLNYALDNEELLNILSTDTLQSDRPSFTKSRNTIKNVKKTSTESLQKIATLCDEEYIKKLMDFLKSPSNEVEKMQYNKEFAEIYSKYVKTNWQHLIFEYNNNTFDWAWDGNYDVPPDKTKGQIPFDLPIPDYTKLLQKEDKE